MRLRFNFGWMILCIFCVGMSGLALGQNAPAAPQAPPASREAPAAVAPDAAPAPTPPSYLLVPYDRAVGPRLGAGDSVLLPYAEFLRLKTRAEGQPESADFKPYAAIAQSSYTGDMKDDVARLEATFVIEAVARPKDNIEVPLVFRGAAVESVSVEGPPASLAPLDSGDGLRVILRGEGRRTLKLRLATRIRTEGPTRLLDFVVPRAAASSFTMHVPEEMTIESRRDTLPATVVARANTGYEIQVSCGSSERIFVAFAPKVKVEGAAAEARLAVNEDILLKIQPSAAQMRANIKTELLSGTARSLEIQLPPQTRILGISGPFVKDWTEPDKTGLIRVALVREISEPFDVSLDMELDPGPDPARVVVPELRVPSARREQGRVRIEAVSGLALWPEVVDGLEIIPAAEGARAFEFSQPGWKLAISRHPVAPRIRAESLILYEVTEEFVRLNTRHHITASNRGLFEVSFTVPEGFDLREAGPSNLVSGFRREGRRVEVSFRGEQNGSFDMDLRLLRPRRAEEKTIAMEPVSVVDAEEDAGSVVLAAPRALRATELQAAGLEAADVRTLQDRLAPLLSPDLAPALGYKFFKPGWRAVAAIERQRTRISCETALLASIDPSLIRVDATLNYNVEFSATDEFQLLLPASAGEEVRFIGADIKEKVRSHPSSSSSVAFAAASASAASGKPAPGADAAELTTWTIRLQRRVIGPYPLRVSFEAPLPAREEGAKPLKVTIPKVIAGRVARETGFIAVSRGENLEVRVSKSEGLEARDVKELPASLASAFLGFRTFEPAKAVLEVELVRHELETVLGALIRRMHIDTVLSDQREAVHEVIFEVQNNREQYLELRLPKGMEIWAAFVRGVPVRSTTRQSDGARLIELTKSESADQAFRVRLILRETLPGGKLSMWGSLRFDAPEPLNMPVLRMTRKLYLPMNYRYLKFTGSMRQETGRVAPWIEPAAEKLLNDLPASAAGGIARPDLNPPISQIPSNYDLVETESERRARIQGSALEIPIVREGQQYEFSKLSGVGTIEVSYWRRKALVIFQGAEALVLLVVLIGLMRKGRRLSVGLIVTLAAFIGASLADGFAGRLFATAALSSAVALAVGFALCLIRMERERPPRPPKPPKPPKTPPMPPISKDSGLQHWGPAQYVAMPPVPGQPPAPPQQGAVLPSSAPLPPPAAPAPPASQPPSSPSPQGNPPPKNQ